MLLGKRQRPPMKRTTSMTEFTLDTNNPPDHRFSSKLHRRNSADYYTHTTSHFLTACHLCNRPLIAGSDIFMYRGDSAFCSLECRQHQMNQDDNKHKTPTSTNASETVVVAL